MLSGFDSICVGTRYRGAEEADLRQLPLPPVGAAPRDGEYDELPGWREDITECRTESDLPANARDYLRYISEAIGVPITLIGVGPGREQVVWGDGAEMPSAPQTSQAA